MRMRAAFAMLLPLLVAGCEAVRPPGPGPAPGGFDCNRPPALSGVVEVAQPIPDRYIVVLKPPAPPPGASGNAAAGRVASRAEIESLAASMAASHGARDVQVFAAALGGFACAAGADAVAGMARDPRVQFVQRDGRKTAVPLPAAEDAFSWGLDRIDQRDLPLDGHYEPGATGAGLHVYVVDTGMDVGHVEFTGRVGEGYSATGDGINDDNGHGTHVAGTIGGTRFGVARQVVLHPVRVLVGGSGSDSDVIEGID